MKVIHALKGSVSQHSFWQEPRGVVSCVHAEIEPGCMLHVSLGEAGVTIVHGDHRVGIPLCEILKLAQQVESNFIPKAEGGGNAGHLAR